jgi:hypothetical protein
MGECALQITISGDNSRDRGFKPGRLRYDHLPEAQATTHQGACVASEICALTNHGLHGQAEVLFATAQGDRLKLGDVDGF